MTFDLQNMVVATAVVGSLAYLGAKGYWIVAGRKGSACGSCSSCADGEADAKPLVQLDVGGKGDTLALLKRCDEDVVKRMGAGGDAEAAINK